MILSLAMCVAGGEKLFQKQQEKLILIFIFYSSELKKIKQETKTDVYKCTDTAAPVGRFVPY